eukprot:CAMPEP_0194298668 /NCGR_PEP_ID=MMETSP0169-20130528/60290_1 /TAXON_ID=218684 /ORGANISM="Corethron pennatum, Strain L29A3" /LENGTH=877 /DNA_ID=CAMNT_0039048677 /DNA_START=941 /DNA_END=3574 /DNA_ORIENTATION=+
MKGSEVSMEESNDNLVEIQMKVPTYSPYDLTKGSDVSIEDPKKKFTQPIASYGPTTAIPAPSANPTARPTPGPTPAPTASPTVGTTARPTALPTASPTKLTLKSVCSVNDNCESGNCYRRSNMETGMCQCSPCLTAGCGGCKSNKYCNLVEGKKFPRCDVYYPSFNEANVAGSELPTKAQVEMRATEPRKVESDPPVALTLFPTVFEKLDIGEHCGRDGDCLSASCFRYSFSEFGLCQCKACFSAGCGGCSANNFCNVTTSLVPNLCLVHTSVPSSIPSEMPSMISSIPSETPSMIPTVWCNFEFGCRKIKCWRDRDCSKFDVDAYCNEMDVCAQKKEIGAVCRDSRECGSGICDRDECRFLSDAPSLAPSEGPTNDFTVVGKAKNAVVDKAKNTIDLVNGTLKDISWYSTLPSHMRIGFIVGLCVIALMLLSTIFLGCYVLLKHRSMPQLKQETERDDSNSDSSISSKSEFFRQCDNGIGSENTRAQSPLWKNSNMPSKTITKRLSQSNYPKAHQKEPLSPTSPPRPQSPAPSVSSEKNVPRNVTAPSQSRALSPAWGVLRPQCPASSVSSKKNFPRHVTAPSQPYSLSQGRSMPRPQSPASSVLSKVDFSRNKTAPSQSHPLSPAWGVPRPQNPASSVSSKKNFPRHVTAPSQPYSLSQGRSMPRPQSPASSVLSKVDFSRNKTAPSQSHPLSPAWGVPRPQNPASSVSSKVSFPRHVTASSQSRPLSQALALPKSQSLASSVSSKVSSPRHVSPARGGPRLQSPASSVLSKVDFSRNKTAPSQSRHVSPGRGGPRPKIPASSVSSKAGLPRHVTAPSQSRPLSPAWGVQGGPRPQSTASSVSSKVRSPRHVTVPSKSRPLSPAGASYKKSGLFA